MPVCRHIIKSNGKFQTSQRTCTTGKNEKLEMTDEDRKVLATDYPEGDVERSKADHYRRRRGSVRLARDLYRTKGEQEEFIDRGLNTRLPGQESHSRTYAWLTGVLRHLFASR